MQKFNLCLHAGANKVEREQVYQIATPERTDTWVPIPHATLVDRFQSTLEANGLRIIQEAHALAKGGNRYFGLLQVVNGHQDDDWGLVVGIRNSHDMSFPAGIVVGSGVFVCDNLAFSGEIKLARKHTVYIERDLPQLVDRAIGQLGEYRGQQEQRIATYKETEFSQVQAHDIIIRAVDARVCPVTYVPDVLKEWREPSHPEHAASGNTAWRLFNAFTENLKGNLDYLPRRTQALHGILDLACKS